MIERNRGVRSNEILVVAVVDMAKEKGGCAGASTSIAQKVICSYRCLREQRVFGLSKKGRHRNNIRRR